MNIFNLWRFVVGFYFLWAGEGGSSSGYANNNPPRLLRQALTGTAKIWRYESSDAGSAVDASGYVTNGGDLGLQVGNLVTAYDSDAPVITAHGVASVAASGGASHGSADLTNGVTIGTSTNGD